MYLGGGVLSARVSVNGSEALLIKASGEQEIPMEVSRGKFGSGGGSSMPETGVDLRAEDLIFR